MNQSMIHVREYFAIGGSTFLTVLHGFLQLQTTKRMKKLPNLQSSFTTKSTYVFEELLPFLDDIFDVQFLFFGVLDGSVRGIVVILDRFLLDESFQRTLQVCESS